MVIIVFRLVGLSLEASPAFAAYQSCLGIHGAKVTLFSVQLDLSEDGSTTTGGLLELVRQLETEKFKRSVRLVSQCKL